MKKFNDFLMKDETFVLLIAGAAAAIFAGTYMFINFNVGAFNEVSVTAMLSDGLNGGDYSAAAGFAAGFLIARILEGPLVGLLDIGGALQTGVGIGIPAVLLSAGITFPLSNFFVSLLCGALIGLVLGIVIIGLEAGWIYAYKAGWQVSTGFIVQSAFLAMSLLLVGYFIFREALTWNKVVGVAICLVGLIFINLK